MNAQRILKEARPLFWPWCAIALVGAVPLVHPPDWALSISLLGWFVGLPILATLSLGNEFQDRTFSLLLSQPVSRMEIWGEKLSVTVVAVLSAVLVFFLAWRSGELQLGPLGFPFAGAWILATIASATFWTLFAKSLLGGFGLNIAGTSFIFFALNLANFLHGRSFFSPNDPSVVSTFTFVFLSYAGVMLWLGGRRLARFQATGGMAGDDLLMAGPDLMPAALVGWLRSRPTGVVLNLFRKELRLLRPVWLISFLAAAYWACLILFGLLHERGFSRQFETAVVIHWVVSTLVIAILAGSLSMGEERTSGTHAWHMTLPAPALLHWGIKLSMALLASFVGAGLLPILIGRMSLSGSPNMIANLRLGNGWLLTLLLLTFASFWSACAAKGTVRAVLCLFPGMMALALAVNFGESAGRKFMDLVVSKFDPFANFGFTNAVSNVPLIEVLMRPLLILAIVLVPVVLFAVIQSYRLFRAQLPDSTLAVIRYLLPLALTAFLWTFSLAAFQTFEIHAKLQVWTVFQEAHEAIEKIQPGTPNLDATHPLQLTGEDLAKASPLSERAQRWLRNSRITVVPDNARAGRGRYCCGENSRSFLTGSSRILPWYVATIHLANGSQCTMPFQAGPGWGILGVVCK